MRPYDWSSSYREAIREDEHTVRLVKINMAVNACLCSLLEIGLDLTRAVEQREILCALHDLRVMTHLHRKYTQEPSYGKHGADGSRP